MTESFEELLKAQLEQPVLRKDGGVNVDRDGNIVTPVRAMVMTVVNEAMRGSIPHIVFIQNMQREQEHDAETIERHKNMVTEEEKNILADLRKEGLADYINHSDITYLAENNLFLRRLNEIIGATDFQPVATEYSRDGNTRQNVNPILALRDKQEQKCRTIWKEMCTNAVRKRTVKKS